MPVPHVPVPHAFPKWDIWFCMCHTLSLTWTCIPVFTLASDCDWVRFISLVFLITVICTTEDDTVNISMERLWEKVLWLLLFSPASLWAPAFQRCCWDRQTHFCLVRQHILLISLTLLPPFSLCLDGNFADAVFRFNANISYSGVLHAVTQDVSGFIFCMINLYAFA